MLLAVNLPLVGLWARLLRVPHAILYPTTVVLSCVGIYSLNHSTFDLGMTAAFAVAGYILKTPRFRASTAASRLCAQSAAGRQSPAGAGVL